jgi:hypothetical protein
MVEAITASWHGNNYQARIFWENAFNLLVPESCVVEVTFEANGPKSFDDVVVRYEPAITRSGPKRVPADYHQVKWHVERAGRFGYRDFVSPDFIGAKSMSLLQRLRDAKSTAPDGSNFTFLTTYRVADGDQLAELIAGTDGSLLLDRLFDGTKTDKSKMGKVRKCWRDHLKIGEDDTKLREILEGLRILEGYRSLDELRTQINFRAQAVGILACHASDSDFRFDELARQLKTRQMGSLSREILMEICTNERILIEVKQELPSEKNIVIRSFIRSAADQVISDPESCLNLTDLFTERYLRDDRSWQNDMRPRVEEFLSGVTTRHSAIRLYVEAHASIAFLAGSVLDFKSGCDVTLIQNGRTGARIWRSDDGMSGPKMAVSEVRHGDGNDILVTISATHDVRRAAEAYRKGNLPDVGVSIDFSPENGTGAMSVNGGNHAAMLADQITSVVRNARLDLGANVHIFAACPNTLIYFLGQHHRAIAPAIIYEFDFDRRGNKTYHPSILMD